MLELGSSLDTKQTNCTHLRKCGNTHIHMGITDLRILLMCFKASLQLQCNSKSEEAFINRRQVIASQKRPSFLVRGD